MKICECVEYLTSPPLLRSDPSLLRRRGCGNAFFSCCAQTSQSFRMPSKRPVISVLSPGFKIPLRGGHDSSHSLSLGAVLAPILQSVYLMVLIFSCNLLRGSQIYPSLSLVSPLGALLHLLFRGEVYNNASLLLSLPSVPPSLTYCKYGVVRGELGSHEHARSNSTLLRRRLRGAS